MSTLLGQSTDQALSQSAGLPLRPLAAVLSLCALILAATGLGLLALCCLILAGAALMPGRGSFLRDLPSAVVLGVAVLLLLAQAAAVPSVPLLRDSLWCRLLLGGAALIFLLVASQARGRKALTTRLELLGSLPAGWLVSIAAVGSVLPMHKGHVWYLAGGSDNITHLVGAIRRAQTGFLDYGADPYPGAWASVTAVVSTAATGSPNPDADVLGEWIGISSAALWLLFAVLTLTVSRLALDLVDRTFIGTVWPGILGFSAAATLLGGAFWGFAVPWGFQTHILASLCVLVAVLEAHKVAEHPLRTGLVVSACGLVAAHSWTLALPFILVPWCFSAWHIYTKGRRRRGIAFFGFANAVAVASVAPLLFAVQSKVGVSHAGAAGAAAAAPWWWILAGVVCSGALLMRKRGQRGLLPLSLGCGVVATIVLTLQVGAELTDYYPSKMLWLAAVLAVPAVWATGGRIVLAVLHRLPSNLGVVTGRAAFTVALLHAAISLATPPVAVFDAAVQQRGAGVLAAASSPQAADAQVVWKAAATPTEDAFVRFLLDYYAPLERQTPIALLDPAEECRLLQAAPRPVVLTRLPRSEVRARYSCVANVDVVRASKN